MKFEVTFRTTYTDDGTRIGKPTDMLGLPEEIVQEETPVRTEPPEPLENREQTDAEINPDYIGTETWEYEIDDGREEDFREALRNCPQVIEYTEMPVELPGAA